MSKGTFIKWAVFVFGLGVLISYPLQNPPLAGGLLTLLGYLIIDRLLAKKMTGKWDGTIDDLQTKENGE